MKKVIFTIVIMVLIVSLTLLGGCSSQNTDTVKYEGEKYVCLEYPVNAFYYDYNGDIDDNFEEVDGIYPINSPQWDMIWNGGDLYCIKNQVSDAINYYSDDSNYDWFVQIDSDDDTDSDPFSIEVTAEELDAVYAVEDKEKDLAVYFDEFDKLGSIIKVSKDGTVRGTFSIGEYNGEWYWRSETIDDSREVDGTWPEYIQQLPESLSNKI